MKPRGLYFIALFSLLMLTGSTLFSQVSVVKNPDVLLWGKSGGEIAKSEMSDDATITCVPDDYSVTSFDFDLNIKGDIMVYSVTGNKLSEQILSALKNLAPGEKFIIENIMAEKPGEQKQKLAAMIFILK